jgi:aminopeptidase N
VLAAPDTATDASYQRVEAIVAHEYFHNWSGNRVTCRDWFQLSLKEGFTVFRDAQFSGDMNSRTVKRIETVNLLRSVQFAEDSGPLAHPVRPDSYLEIGNFYTPTVYEKGSEVVGMLHTLLGPERFRAGSDLYFARHDGSAATTDDFLAAMSEAGALDLTQFRLWYEQAGTPVLEVDTDWRDGRFTVRFAQTCPPTPGQPLKAPMHLPVMVGLLDADGRELAGPGLVHACTDPVEIRRHGDSPSLLVHVRSAACELTVDGLTDAPTLSVLRGFSAPVRLDYPRSPQTLAFLAEHDSDGFARWDALQSLLVKELARRMAGESSDGVVVDLFGRLLRAAIDVPATAEPMAMLAAMLRLPDENYLYEQFAPVDVDGIALALEGLTDELARVHHDGWCALHERHSVAGAYSPDAGSMARRSLAHVALGYRVRGLDADRGAAMLERSILRPTT